MVIVELDPVVMPYQISTLLLLVDLLANVHVVTPPPVTPVPAVRLPFMAPPVITSRSLFAGAEGSVTDRVWALATLFVPSWTSVGVPGVGGGATLKAARTASQLPVSETAGLYAPVVETT